MKASLTEHLDEEESKLLPLIEEHITVAERAEFAQRSFDKFPRSALPRMLGQALESATPEERLWFLDDLPLFVRVMWRVSGQRGYRRYIRRVRGKEYGPRAAALFGSMNGLAARLYRRGSAAPPKTP